jgi:hypothetical protein
VDQVTVAAPDRGSADALLADACGRFTASMRPADDGHWDVVLETDDLLERPGERHDLLVTALDVVRRWLVENGPETATVTIDGRAATLRRSR